MKESSLLKVFDGDRLVHLVDGCDNADKRPLSLFEKEVLRIFGEHKRLQQRIAEAIKYLKSEAEKIGRDPELPYEYWDGYVNALTDFDQALKGE